MFRELFTSRSITATDVQRNTAPEGEFRCRQRVDGYCAGGTRMSREFAGI